MAVFEEDLDSSFVKCLWVGAFPSRARFGLQRLDGDIGTLEFVIYSVS